MLNTPDWSSENQLTSCGCTPNWLAGIHVCGIPALNPIFSQEWILPMGDFAHIFPKLGFKGTVSSFLFFAVNLIFRTQFSYKCISLPKGTVPCPLNIKNLIKCT
jgi:hypothetical protein